MFRLARQNAIANRSRFALTALAVVLSVAFLRAAVDDRNQTTVMVTHDPVAASWADRVVFIVDGRVHHELVDPDADEVLEIIKSFGR